MAVRFSAGTQAYTCTVTLGTQTQISAGCWFKITTDRNAESLVLGMGAAGSVGTDYTAIMTSADGTTQAIWQDNTVATTMSATTVGTWYYIAFAVNGANMTCWMRAATASTWTTFTASNFSANTAFTQLYIGAHPQGPTSFFLNGCVASVKIWHGVTLTLPDIENEAWQYVPRRTANLTAWYPLLRAETVDYSGNGRTLSGGSGATTEDGPPIRWSADPATISAYVPATPAVQFQGWGVPV